MRVGVFSALAALALFGCTSIIGTREIFLDRTGGDGGPGDGAPGDDGGPGSEGGPGNDGGGEPDGSSCGDLTTSTNCGRCGHDCLGGACNAGTCAPVMINGKAAGRPWAVAVDNTNVYYSDISGGSVYKVAKSGLGGPMKIASTTDPLVYDLRIDTTNVYFSSGSLGNGGAVEMVPLAGGTKQTIAMSAPGASDSRGISIDAQYIYWANTDTPIGIERATKTMTATVTPLATSEAEPSVTIVDGTILWWNNKGAGKLRRCTLPACSDASDLTTGLTDPDVLAKNSARIFYNSGSSVLQIPKNSPIGPGAVVAANQSLPVAIVADEKEIYWINLGDYQQSFVDGDIRRCPVVNGAADCKSTPKGEGEVVAKPGASLARGIAVDATAVYWTEEQAGAVYRLAR